MKVVGVALVLGVVLAGCAGGSGPGGGVAPASTVDRARLSEEQARAVLVDEVCAIMPGLLEELEVRYDGDGWWSAEMAAGVHPGARFRLDERSGVVYRENAAARLFARTCAPERLR